MIDRYQGLRIAGRLIAMIAAAAVGVAAGTFFGDPDARDR